MIIPATLLTGEGRALLAEAWPLWRKGHAAIEGKLSEPGRLRADLRILARPGDAEGGIDEASPRP
ncbi:MAG: hypothetical protein AB7T14_00205 [Candidatus Methylacidiphilaceae bacterium]